MGTDLQDFMATPVVNVHLGELLTGVGKLLIVVAFMAAAWYIINSITKFNDEDVIVRGKNIPYSVQRAALTAAQGIGMAGALEPYTGNGWADLGWLTLEGVWVLILLLITRKVVDWVLLYKVDNTQALKDGNGAVGAYEAGFYIGYGAILFGTLHGNAPDWQTGFGVSLVFTALALTTLVVSVFIHEAITPYNVRNALERGVTAAGIEGGAVMVAISLPLASAVAGDFTGWTYDIGSFVLNFAAALVLVYLGRWAVDKFVLRTCTISDLIEGNLVAGTVYMAVSLVAISAVGTLIVGQLGAGT